MTDELKPVRCGCGGEARIGKIYGDAWTVECTECAIQSGCYDTEAEAVTAWNRAMGERTKGEWSEIDGCHLCGECGFAVTPHCDVYCAECGAKLDWSDHE